MRRMKTGLALTAAIALVTACGGKKDGGDTKEDPAADGGETKEGENTETKTGETPTLSDNIKTPAGAIALALGSMESIMATDVSAKMVGGGAALTGDDGGFTEADCNQHAEAVWRSTDDVSFKGDSGGDQGDGKPRLREGHPRYALQSLYCQMQKDTGSPDSFLGAISQNKMLFCVMKDLAFDGQEKAFAFTKTEFLACLDKAGADQQTKDDMTSNMPENVNGKLTSAAPAAFGKPGDWDASIDFNVDIGGEAQVLKILLKDDADHFAMAVNNNGGHKNPTDGYVVHIGKKTGEVHFEGKFQRIRETNGEGNNGWDRHARVYVKGTMDENLKFSAVSAVQGAFSDVSVNAGQVMPKTLAAAKTQQAKLWAVVGDDAKGFLSNTYKLNCTDYSEQTGYTCPDINKAASWVGYAEATLGACNGGQGTDGDKCTGADLKLKADGDTAFAMDGKNAAFQTTEAWMSTLALPTYTSVSLTISQ